MFICKSGKIPTTNTSTGPMFNKYCYYPVQIGPVQGNVLVLRCSRVDDNARILLLWTTFYFWGGGLEGRCYSKPQELHLDNCRKKFTVSQPSLRRWNYRETMEMRNSKVLSWKIKYIFYGVTKKIFTYESNERYEHVPCKIKSISSINWVNLQKHLRRRIKWLKSNNFIGMRGLKTTPTLIQHWDNIGPKLCCYLLHKFV